MTTTVTCCFIVISSNFIFLVLKRVETLETSLQAEKSQKLDFKKPVIEQFSCVNKKLDELISSLVKRRFSSSATTAEGSVAKATSCRTRFHGTCY